MSAREHLQTCHASVIAYEEARQLLEDENLRDARICMEQQGQTGGAHRHIWVDDIVTHPLTGREHKCKCLLTVVEIVQERQP